MPSTLIETKPGEAGRVCVFESSAGGRFSLVKPGMSEERVAKVVGVLRGWRKKGISERKEKEH